MVIIGLIGIYFNKKLQFRSPNVKFYAPNVKKNTTGLLGVAGDVAGALLLAALLVEGGQEGGGRHETEIRLMSMKTVI